MDEGVGPLVIKLPAALAERVDMRMLCLESCELAPWRALLDPVERQRSARFARARDSARFCLGRGLLRVMLGQALDRPAAALSFEVGPHGKPRLAGARARAFNVSHSGDCVIVAVARARSIGVDIERHRSDIDLARLARRVLTAAETRAVCRHSGEAGTADFFRYWVLKEAVVKALGAGLSVDPRSIEIETTPEPITATLANGDGRDRLKDWEIIEVDAPHGYSAAMALCP